MKRSHAIRAVFVATAIAGCLASAACQPSDPPPPSAAAPPEAAAPAPVPTFVVDKEWPKVPAKWKLGDVSSIAFDDQNHSLVLHRPRTLEGDDFKMAAPPVMEFDEAGNFVRGWGGDGAGYDWPQREHGIYVDYKGNIWIGGNYCPARSYPRLKPVYDDTLVKFTREGKFLLQIGKPSGSTGNADTKNLHEPADIIVLERTNEAFVADGYGNHRVIVFDADTGAFKRMWGAFGNTPVDDDVCPSEANPRKPVPVDMTGDGAPQFAVVHSLRISKDEIVYVGDREHKRVQSFTLDGKYLQQYLNRDQGGFGNGISLSKDPEERFLYVSAPEQSIMVLDRKTMKPVGAIKPEGSRGGGHQMFTDHKGNIYTAQFGNGAQRLLLQSTSTPTQ